MGGATPGTLSCPSCPPLPFSVSGARWSGVCGMGAVLPGKAGREGGREEGL